MSRVLEAVLALVDEGKVRVSAHGFDEMANDDIGFAELLAGVGNAQPVEEYPDYHKGPCVLVLQRLADTSAVHVLWGLAANSPELATLVTAYRPDPHRWSADLLTRKPR